jgi:hypothetical protein
MAHGVICKSVTVEIYIYSTGIYKEKDDSMNMVNLAFQNSTAEELLLKAESFSLQKGEFASSSIIRVSVEG